MFLKLNLVLLRNYFFRFCKQNKLKHVKLENFAKYKIARHSKTLSEDENVPEYLYSTMKQVSEYSITMWLKKIKASQLSKKCQTPASHVVYAILWFY